MTQRPLPRYVERGGELVYSVPYAARNAEQFVFILEADSERLATTLKRDFADPSRGAVTLRPSIGLIILSVSRIEAIQSVADAHRDLGAGISELEVAFMTVAVDTRRDRPVVVVPYLFVDSGMAVAAGRELFGLPKQHGAVTIGGAKAPERITVDALAAERFDPRAPFISRRVLEIAAAGPVGDVRAIWKSLAEATAGLRRAVGDAASVARPHRGGVLGLVERAIEDVRALVAAVSNFASSTFPLVGLKQFRDLTRPDLACYQAITEAPLVITGFQGGGLLGDYEVTLPALASEPIAPDLGLASSPLRPLVSAWLRYDFRLEPGAELWNAHDGPETA